MIQLISDTVTRPTEAMKRYMFNADVGDDVFKEDPTVNKLESRVANMFGKEAALFCPSGTMTNQLAIKVHTNPLDELICEVNSHVYQYETAGYGFNSGIGIQLIEGDRGRLNSEQVKDAIRPLHDWLPKSKLVVLENSGNRAGGSYYTLDQIQPISELCRQHGLAIHLDGARLFNVLVETNEKTEEYGKYFDSISICLSKGLGAPVGSVLTGTNEFISEARRFRKVMGGGMRQVGYMAAAGIYALDHHIDRLIEDNNKAKRLGKAIGSLDYVTGIRPVETNIVIFDIIGKNSASEFLDYLKDNNISGSTFGPQTIRFVTHLDITDKMIDHTISVLENYRR